MEQIPQEPKDLEREKYYDQLCAKISCMRVSNSTGYCGLHEPTPAPQVIPPAENPRPKL